MKKVFLRYSFGLLLASLLTVAGLAWVATRLSPVPTVVEGFAETEPVEIMDDPAIWTDPAIPGSGRLLGAAKGLGLYVYDLKGRQVQRLAGIDFNNVDVLHDPFKRGEARALVVGSNRKQNALELLWLDAATGLLDVESRQQIVLDLPRVYGVCLYAGTLGVQAFVTSKEGPVARIVLQADDGSGEVHARELGRYDVSSVTEGCVADTEADLLFVSQERRGLWRFDLHADMAKKPEIVDRTWPFGRLTREVEGVSLLATGKGRGYLVVSSQGSDELMVYRRGGDHTFLGRMQIRLGPDLVTHTDGVDLAMLPDGGQGRGLLAVHDDRAGRGQNLKLVEWDAVAKQLKLDLAAGR